MANPMSTPNIDLSVLLVQFTPQLMQLALQMSQAGTIPVPAAGPLALAALALAALAPAPAVAQASALVPTPVSAPTSALAPTTTSTEDDGANRPTIKFKYGPRPKGTPGRGDFKLRKAFGIDRYSYKLLLRGTKRICILTNLDMTKSIRNQDQRRVRKVCDRGLIAFPEIQNFNDPEWPMRALMS